MKLKVFALLIAAIALLTSCGPADTTDTDGTTTTADSVVTTTSGATDADEVTTTTGSKAPTNKAPNSTASQKTTTTTEFILQSTVTTFKRIEPERSAEETAKLINNKLTTPATKMPLEKKVIWYPKSADDWTMSQHASVAVLNGKVYVMWSNAREHEDGCGQRIMYSCASVSDFQNWSTPKVVPGGETEIGQYAEMVKMNGFAHTYDGTLYVSFSSFEWLPEDMLGPNTRPQTDATHVNLKSYVVSTTDGINWKKADGVTVPHRPASMVTKRYFNVGGQGLVSYTDDPSGLNGWDVGAVSNFDKVVNDYGFTFIGEATSYQTADGIVRACWRADCGYIVMAESYNNGVTFTRPYITNFTNGYSKFVFGHLDDGRTFCIYNREGRDRIPLSIALSEDGINFNKEYIIRDEQQTMQYPGIGKGGHYSYPSYCIDGGYIYITYVLQKEGVEVTRIKISDLK